MLHKKRKPSTFTSSSGRNVAAKNNMLHSKSTYFYRWLSNLGAAGRSYNSANGIRCPSPHCEQNRAGSDTLCANRTRDSREMMPYSRIASYAGSPGGRESRLARSRRQTNSCSKITGRTGTYLVPAMCGLALLLGIGIILNPVMGEVDRASATTVTANPTGYSSISLTISNNGTEINDGSTVSTNVEPGLISYISNNLKIDTKKINRFYVSVQAAEDGSTELTGTNNHATIAPVGSNKIPTATDSNGFGDNTWGFALGEANTANESMSYNSLPAYGTSTIPQYSSATNLADGTYNLKLTFAAKINADKPSDHYTTKAMVSVAADAKNLVDLVSGLGGVKKMQDFTSAICNSLTTPSASATNVPTGQLVDTRDNSIYWVSKLKDGKCWMTQNLDLPLTASTVLTSADTNIKDVSGKYTISYLGNYKDPGMVVYKASAASGSLPSSDTNCGDPAASGCSPYFEAYTGSISGDKAGHYLVGDYYPWTIAMAGKTTENSGSICPKGWKLPTKAEYSALAAGLDVDSVRNEPYYFVPVGYYNVAYGLVGSRGHYWSSTVAQNSLLVYDLYFGSAGVYPLDDIPEFGRSVRCVVE